MAAALYPVTSRLGTSLINRRQARRRGNLREGHSVCTPRTQSSISPPLWPCLPVFAFEQAGQLLCSFLYRCHPHYISPRRMGGWGVTALRICVAAKLCAGETVGTSRGTVLRMEAMSHAYLRRKEGVPRGAPIRSLFPHRSASYLVPCGLQPGSSRNRRQWMGISGRSRRRLTFGDNPTD